LSHCRASSDRQIPVELLEKQAASAVDPHEIMALSP
jgi:hypothetical protein